MVSILPRARRAWGAVWTGTKKIASKTEQCIHIPTIGRFNQIPGMKKPGVRLKGRWSKHSRANRIGSRKRTGTPIRNQTPASLECPRIGMVLRPRSDPHFRLKQLSWRSPEHLWFHSE